MTSKLCFLMALLLSPIAVAQSAPGANAATYSVTGMVQNSVTGEPIAHALVQLGGESQKAVFTDSGGRFEFDQLPAGMMTFASARKPGFLGLNEVDPAAPLSMIRPGPDAAPVVLKLVPEGIIFGRAQKPDGEPIGFLQIQAVLSHITDGRKTLDMMNSIQTNEEGEFRIAGLRPGTYYLQAGPRYGTTWIGTAGQRAREAAYRPVFYPGTSDLASAAPLEVAAGQQVEADLALSPDPVFRVSGTMQGVPDANPDEVWPRLQFLYRSNDVVAVPVEAQPGNEFQAKVPAGTYMLRADVDTNQGSYRGEIPVNVQSDVSGLSVMLAPAPEIRVNVTSQRSRSQPNAPSGVQADRVSIRFRNQRMKVPSDDYGFDGMNVIRGVNPGAYALEITPFNSDLYVESAQCGGVDLLREDLVIGQGPLPPIQVVLRDDGGSLRGTLMSEGHEAAGTVLLIPDRAPRQIKASVNGRGRFQFGKLAPGDYTVLAVDRIDNLEYRNPDVLASYLSNATHVSVAANGDSQITVNLIRITK